MSNIKRSDPITIPVNKRYKCDTCYEISEVGEYWECKVCRDSKKHPSFIVCCDCMNNDAHLTHIHGGCFFVYYKRSRIDRYIYVK